MGNNVKYNIVKSFKSTVDNSKSSSLYTRAGNCRKYIRKDYKIVISSSPGSFVLSLFKMPIGKFVADRDCIYIKDTKLSRN